MSTWKQALIVLALVASYLAILFLLLRVLLLIDTALSLALSATIFAIIQLGGLVALFFLLRSLLDPRAYRETRAHGLVAPATILEVVETGWRKRRRVGGWLARERIVAREYRLRARVDHPERDPYEATLFAYLEAREVPKRGATVSVKVHRQHPAIVVLAVDDLRP